MHNTHALQPKPRSWVIIDIESAVTDESGHRRYMAMERWVPTPGKPARRSYERSADPLQTPRWPFQTIVAAAIMILVEHDDGNVDVASFTPLSAPELDEKGVMSGIIDALAAAPDGAELCSWAGMLHDVPLMSMACKRHGLTYPAGWRWLGFGGNDPVRHLDLARTTTGGFKMKPIHLAEVLASLDIPAKITVPAFAVAPLINQKRWELVRSVVENDVISTALLLAHWRKLHDPRTELHVVKDRILRRVDEMRPGALYLPELRAYRTRLFKAQQKEAEASMAAFAPWLQVAA